MKMTSLAAVFLTICAVFSWRLIRSEAPSGAVTLSTEPGQDRKDPGYGANYTQQVTTLLEKPRVPKRSSSALKPIRSTTENTGVPDIVSKEELMEFQKIIFSGGKLTDKDLAQLRLRLAKLPPFRQTSAIVCLPAWLNPYFSKDAVKLVEVAAKTAGAPGAGGNYTDYLVALESLAYIDSADAAQFLLQEMPKLPDFRFPDTPPSLGHAAFGDRGPLGRAASALVTIGDPEVMDRFCEDMLKSSHDKQRVMLWAMRNSASYDDFDFLMQMREVVSDPATLQDIRTAMNHIAQRIRFQARSNPDIIDDQTVFTGDVESRTAMRDQLKIAADAADKFLHENKLYDSKAGMRY